MDVQEIVASIQKYEKPFQLVKHLADVPESKLQYPAYLQIKYDGVFCAVVSDGVRAPVLLSRTGRALYTDGLWEDARYPEGVWICELTNASITLEELSGLVNPNRVQPWSEHERYTMKADAALVCHDYVPVEFWSQTHAQDMVYTERLWYLQDTWPGLVATTLIVYSPEEAQEQADLWIKAGHEGAVQKALGALYVPGHKGWHAVKIVRGCDFDLGCVGFELGKAGTKRAGLVNKLILEFRGGTFKADLGAGWTDARRADLTAELLSWRNAGGTKFGIWHVHALQVSSTGKALRLPKVLERRIDKEEPDA